MASEGGEPGAVLPEPSSTRPTTACACGLGTTVAGDDTTLLSVVSCSRRTYRPAGIGVWMVYDQAILAGAGSVSPLPPSVRVAAVKKIGATGSYWPAPVRSRAQRYWAEPPALVTSK